ncbi:TauD/TfdA family dioxygenase [Microbulbifer halophilus]|uniref:TauD/TfdA family dioxygenase n=1 Tax=Microbulbifer halophilus TaxID=453963 RepID=A0ABW5E931_9GAMM|nr:TauD/TfdA family dioxygenase [Microbulbifer halophilus]MCW8127252.1 TauD/TfdA family dioxygenase [Microbulbifer halophilus]
MTSVTMGTLSRAGELAGDLGGAELPLVLTPAEAGADWRSCIEDIRLSVDRHLHRVGGLLLRGFGFSGEDDFEVFARSFGHDLLSYDYASTPRTRLNKGVYTSTEYPAHQVIPLHNEQSYTLQWPMKIWFHSVHVAESGGETPIADSREVYRCLDAGLRRRFADRGLMYVRNYGNGLDLPWQQAFNTEDRAVVENFCRANRIDFEWKPDGELRTRQRCQAVAAHPVTGEMVWFNQAHLFHLSSLAPQMRETLLSVVGEAELPRNVYYGDGAPIEESALDEIRGVLGDCQVVFPWQKGDVMMLDNMLVAHGRSTYRGERKVVVAMAEPCPQAE